MILRLFAILFGVGFIFSGVAGFFPVLMPNGLLLGLFQVDAVSNIGHIISGVIAIMAATSYKYARLYFQIFGIIYGLVTFIGFITNGDFGFMKTQFNVADNILHLVISVAALYLGFATKTRVP